MSWLLNAEPISTDTAQNARWLLGDSRIAIVAGSRTTTTTIVWCLYHLARDISHISQIRKEMQGFHQHDPMESRWQLNKATYLNAFIYETLRLHPPNASGVYRQSPNEGLQVGTRFIPGDTTLRIPFWSLMRCRCFYSLTCVVFSFSIAHKCFSRPDDFLPQRWTTEPQLVLRKDCFIPFSAGKYGCVGKNLALMNARAIIARVVMRFDVKFAPGEDGTTLWQDSRDLFTVHTGDLKLQFLANKT